MNVGTLNLTNTMSGRREPFVPETDNHVRMYSCGLTVYNRGHIGNFRTFVSQDVLKRYLRYKGFEVTQVMNFTDVDDKTIRGANEAGESLREHTDRYIEFFFEDNDSLNILRAEHYPRATDQEYIDAMVGLVEKLTERGHTYQSDGSIYFRISSLPNYGKLSRIDVSGMQSGARVDSDEYGKEDARDFVLWKASKPDEPSWDTPIGPGRPGWHLECSAMGMKLLGDSFDLHGGGVDLIFPHHENEIAQSEGATGKPFVRHWMHSEFLLVEGQKMSKSLGNQFTVRDLLDEGYSAASIRYLLMSVYYRKQLNFTREGLTQAQTAISRVRDFLRRLDEVEAEGEPSERTQQSCDKALQEFELAMDDDLNTSAALAALFHLVRDGNVALTSSSIVSGDARLYQDTVHRMDSVFGVFESNGDDETLAADVERLIEERREARARRDFQRSDAIRDELLAKGIELQDTPKGTRWIKR